MNRILLAVFLFAPAAAQTSGVAQAPAQPPVLLKEGHMCAYYPWRAHVDHAEGAVKLRFTVTTDGTVADVVIVQSSGNASLDDGASDCVKTWQYRPSLKDGVSAEANVEVMATYSMPEHGRGSVVWKMSNTRTVGDVATRSLTDEVLKCLKSAPGIQELVATVDESTIVKISYERGEMSHVSVFSSSGNSALDKIAVDCFLSAPGDAARTEDLQKLSSSIIAVRWTALVHVTK